MWDAGSEQSMRPAAHGPKPSSAEPDAGIQAPVDGLTVLTSGEAAYRAMLTGLDLCSRKIEFSCFVWRDDETGNLVARRFLAAADRGVMICVEKDKVGAIYEHFDPNMHSAFHKRLGLPDRVRVALLRFLYDRDRARKQQPNSLIAEVVSHPQVSFRLMDRLHDHSKVLILDDEVMFLGGMGVGDDFRHDWLDLMVRLDGAQHVHRFRERRAGLGGAVLRRPIDFLVNVSPPGRARYFRLMEERLRALDATRASLHIEMAYLGDERVSRAIERCVARGVEVVLLCSARANILADCNLRFLERLRRRVGDPPNLRLFLHPRMVHAKLMVFDRRVADVGSANLTALSHDVFDETDVWIQDPQAASALADVVEEHASAATRVRGEIRYVPWRAAIEWALQNQNPISLGIRGRR